MENKTVIIKPKLSTNQIAMILDDHNIIKYPSLFAFLAKIYSLKHSIKSGEYIFTQNISPMQTLRILSSGKSIIHKMIIPEGMLVHEIIKKINSEERLVGEIIGTIPEGFLMPSTYFFSYGDQKEQIIDKMRKLMSLQLDKAMEKLSPNSPLKTRLEVLILASIVEKEASLNSDKPSIAAVFLNRLKKHMKLQSDVTTIYAITLGKDKLTRPLTKKDFAIQSPYNTYYIANLPVGAISCPGVKSLESVVNPAKINSLYFVGNGAGGHNFSNNFNDHNKHVKNYRKKFEGTLSMDNTKFTKLAEQTISLIAEIIETEDKDCLIDIDFQGDILTLTTNQGIFVINKHSAAKEIWLSSPISGPYHFYYAADRWQSKSSDDLVDILEQELKINFRNTSKN